MRFDRRRGLDGALPLNRQVPEPGYHPRVQVVNHDEIPVTVGFDAAIETNEFGRNAVILG